RRRPRAERLAATRRGARSLLRRPAHSCSRTSRSIGSHQPNSRARVRLAGYRASPARRKRGVLSSQKRPGPTSADCTRGGADRPGWELRSLKERGTTAAAARNGDTGSYVEPPQNDDLDFHFLGDGRAQVIAEAIYKLAGRPAAGS